MNSLTGWPFFIASVSPSMIAADVSTRVGAALRVFGIIPSFYRYLGFWPDLIILLMLSLISCLDVSCELATYVYLVVEIFVVFMLCGYSFLDVIEKHYSWFVNSIIRQKLVSLTLLESFRIFILNTELLKPRLNTHLHKNLAFEVSYCALSWVVFVED